MKKSYIVILVVALVAIAGLVLWMSMQSSAPVAVNNAPVNTNVVANVPPANVPPANVPTPGMIKVLTLNTIEDAKLGTRLVSSDGKTLYYFTKDVADSGLSACTGACTSIWPAYTVGPDASLAGGTLVTGKIATITLPNGTMQVTYNGLPLYFFHTDADGGDTYGQGVNNVWYVAKP